MTFEEFLAAELPGLTRFSAVLTGNRHLAEDVLQDALVRAHARWGRIGGMDRPDAYVRRIVTTSYLSWRRLWATRKIHPVEDLSKFEYLENTPDPAVSVVRTDHVRRLVASLPRRQRAAVVLRFYVGCDDTEAATAMGCSVQTVRSHISRALDALRAHPSMREHVETGAKL
ncbi:RNA polymerase sigma-70 factor (sigma-E family) [Herbihabitans rhizosphaerae]|uniref:RNA polymerase sigma-70 factor (Sigma-E family) n=1 Tax=Herbihabitans rhizosphaerae TaxID=1872711 RepID=A0A4Q7KVD9_9PSEU|nr:SigE family RNA polymerase sigma factor [Herbihabitans rhizosphaerae]RZS40979.1 RNA polymerase sigma-70 factor (sigma-E family) [Herbihabitans rhizosphaerae]